MAGPQDMLWVDTDSRRHQNAAEHEEAAHPAAIEEDVWQLIRSLDGKHKKLLARILQLLANKEHERLQVLLKLSQQCTSRKQFVKQAKYFLHMPPGVVASVQRVL